MTEYYLQKKTIGGWSHVTSYQDEVQARRNYLNCVGNGLSGYCWRLVEVKELEVSMLNDEIPFHDAMLIEGDVKRPWGQPSQDKKSGWGVTPTAHSSPNRTSIDPGATEGLSGERLNPDQQADVNNAWGNFKTCNTVSAKPEHGLAGKVWMVNHSTKTKVRVSAAEVKLMEEAGYERGGPRTQFKP